MLDMSYEKKEFPPYTFQIERQDKETALAIGDNNPLFLIKKYAQRGGKDTSALVLHFRL